MYLEYIISFCFPLCLLNMNVSSVNVHAFVCVCVCVRVLQASESLSLEQSVQVRCIKSHQAPQICHIHLKERRWVDDSSALANPNIMCSHTYSPNLTFQPLHSTNNHSVDTPITLYHSLFALLFSYWAESQRDWDSALMNKTRLLDSYVWKERWRKWEGGGMKLNWAPYFFPLVSLPLTSLCPCREFSRGKSCWGNRITACLCMCIYDMLSVIARMWWNGLTARSQEEWSWVLVGVV